MMASWPTPIPRVGDTLNRDYLTPLVAKMRGIQEAENLVAKITANSMTVDELATSVEHSMTHGFNLMREGNLTGKHDKHNYKSASQTFRAQTHKSLLKRLNTNKTIKLDGWTGDIACRRTIRRLCNQSNGCGTIQV